MKIAPIVLEGETVKLAPLKLNYLDRLYEAANDESLWFWTVNVIKSKDDLRRYVETALREFESKISLPFVIKEKSTDKIIGSTRFGNIDIKNRKAEIGWTWINPRWQRTRVNTEAKLLMLTHAFEIWKCVRVELKTDALNEKSRNAILRIGAKEEGILRNHMITDTGRFRDTVYFSIIDSEWQTVKAVLNEKLRSFT
jgi:N-acetyltransferase